MFKFRKVAVLLVVMSVLIATVVAPGFANDTSVQSDDNAQLEGIPLIIGVLTDHTGALSFYGFEQTQGFDLGLEYATESSFEIAGRPIEVVVRDNGGSIDQAIEDARDLVENEGAEILVGTVSSSVTLALQGSAIEYEIVLMAGPSATPAITGDNFNEFTFRVCRNSFHDAAAVASFAEETYGTNYVVLASDDAFGVGSGAAYDFILQQRGFTAVRDAILVSPDSTDFTSAITEVRDSGADFVIPIWAGASGVQLFSQMNDLEIRDTMGVITGFNSNDIQAALNLNQPGDVGLIVYHYTAPDTEVNDWLVENHLERFEGDPPDLFTECGFATAQALVAALETTAGETLPDELVPALEGLEFEGPKGTYFIRPEDHQALVPIYVMELVDTEPEQAFAFYDLVAEISAEDSAPPCLAPGRSSDEVECPPAAE